MEMGDLFRRMMGMPENRKVIRRIPMQDSWVRAYEEIKETEKDMALLTRRLDHLQRAFWIKVEQDAETYEPMRLSDDRKTVEVLG